MFQKITSGFHFKPCSKAATQTMAETSGFVNLTTLSTDQTALHQLQRMRRSCRVLFYETILGIPQDGLRKTTKELQSGYNLPLDQDLNRRPPVRMLTTRWRRSAGRDDAPADPVPGMLVPHIRNRRQLNICTDVFILNCSSYVKKSQLSRCLSVQGSMTQPRMALLCALLDYFSFASMKSRAFTEQLVKGDIRRWTTSIWMNTSPDILSSICR
jgi:hypothetical protein